jgi:Phytanoyl-CoA dioxygenase (PhyH)
VLRTSAPLIGALDGMTSFVRTFEEDGYLVVGDAISESDIVKIESQLRSTPFDGAGTRNLLSAAWCQELARRLKRIPAIREVLPPDAVTTQCTYFHKSESNNWLVALHRDLSIPVKAHVNSKGWSAWSEKEGVLFAHPPEVVLESVVAVRLHLEENTDNNSPLQVVPGSHVGATNRSERVTCLVPRGGVLIMRPLILHASSKLKSGTRRVLHFVFGPSELPNKAEWAHAV